MKKMIKVAALGIAGLAFAATSVNAADYQITLAGASAQYKYWKDTAPDFLQNDYPACTTVEKYADSATYADDQGLAYGTGCKVNGGTNDTVLFRYVSIASYTGVQLPLGLEAGTGCAAGEWPVVDLNTCYDNGDAATGSWDGGCDTLTCAPINLGASDVAGEAFSQSSSGWEEGPVFTGAPVGYVQNSSDILVDTTSYTNLQNRRPIVVPFSLFVTDDVKNMPTIKDNLANPQNNMTRLQAALLLSGQATNWEDVNIDANDDGTAADPMGTDTRVTLCYRHAGSGTHATMDHVLLHGDASMVYETQNITSAGPKVWFNIGSSDLMRCLSYDGSGTYPVPTEYAIGYADSDKCGDGFYGMDGEFAAHADTNSDGFVTCADMDDPATAADESIGCSDDWSSKCVGVERVAYQGVDASRDAIKNCSYPYWAAQWIYYDTNVLDANDVAGTNGPDNGLNVLTTKLMDYASDPTKLSATGAVRANYWATQNEMNCGRNFDWTYPAL